MPNIREIQERLSKWATDHPEERYCDLFNLVCSRNWLLEAYIKISRNKGANTPGIDGITLREWERNLATNLEELSQEVLEGRYKPQPCQRTYIPKKSGKMRPLGIPTFRDKIVQEAIKMAIEPIFETDFSKYSYGFQPNRSTHDAMAMVRTWMIDRKRMYYVIEGDIKAYFDNISHKKLMSLIKKRVKDKHVLSIIWLFLKAGVMENGLFSSTGMGTPQGGVISPLLANIYLHELDRYLYDRNMNATRNEKQTRRRRGGNNIGYVRYADDFVIFCNGHIEDVKRLKNEIADFLHEELHLALSEEKTLITHVNDGFEFLGFKFYRGLDRSGKFKPKTKIPDAKIESVKEKIKSATASNQTFLAEVAMFKNLNSILRGWGNYYKYTCASKRFTIVDRYAYWRVIGWYRRKYKWTTAQVLRFRKSRTEGNLRLFAEWMSNDGKKHLHLFNLLRDMNSTEYYCRKIANPFLEE